MVDRCRVEHHQSVASSRLEELKEKNITHLSSPSGQKSDIVASGKRYDALEQGCDDFRAGAARYVPHLPSGPLPRPVGERKGECGAGEEERWQPLPS